MGCGQGGERDDAGECSLQDPEVGGGLGRDRAEGVGRKLLGLLAGEVSEEDEPGGQIRRLDGDRQPPREPVPEALGKRKELGGNAVGGEDELGAALI
jgi:hypothetical protein